MSKLLIPVFLMVICLVGFTSGYAQQPDAAAIKKQMSDIRKSTNWEDPEAAKKANEKIKALSKQLMSASNAQNSGGGDASRPQQQNNSGEANQDATNQKMEMWEQVTKSAAKDKHADIWLAEPVREQIKDEYKEDEAEQLNPAMLSESSILILDFSFPGTELLISQMEWFKSIKTLVVLGYKSVISANLNNVLAKAKGYPLTELYLVGFQSDLTTIPENVFQFTKLDTLGLICNQIKELPPSFSKLAGLKALHIDYNPIKTLMPIEGTIKELEILTIKETEISLPEIESLKKLNPNCKIKSE